MPKPLTADRIREAIERANCNWQDAAVLLGVPVTTFRNRALKLRKEGHDIPGPRGHINRAQDFYKPTRKEIRAACKEFQENWTKAEKKSRRVSKLEEYTVPIVEAPGEPREEIW